MIKGQIIGVISYGIITVFALYFSKIAIIMTFFMWVFWAIATKDKVEDFNY